jgi:hypothetical protein
VRFAAPGRTSDCDRSSLHRERECLHLAGGGVGNGRRHLRGEDREQAQVRRLPSLTA